MATFSKFFFVHLLIEDYYLETLSSGGTLSFIKLHSDKLNLLSQAAYVAVMQTANSSNKSGFESLLRVYRESDLSQEKVRILSMLRPSSLMLHFFI